MFTMSLQLICKTSGLASLRLNSIARHLATSTRVLDKQSPHEKPTKPDLRRAATDTRQKHIIVAACLLVAIYMYPMIFKPLFGIGSLDQDDDRVKTMRDEISKHRQDFMPEWSNPFAPKKED